LVKPLPSIPSTSGFPALFGDFSGTTGLSDFPSSFIVDVRLWTSRRAPVLIPPGEYGISRFPCEVLPYVYGVFDREGPRHTSRYRCASVLSRKYLYIVARLYRGSNRLWRSRRMAAPGDWNSGRNDRFSRPVLSHCETSRDEWLVA